jgi:PAS domain S-box-containing protein
VREVSVLFYEDFPDDQELMLRQLRAAGYSPTTRRVDAEADLREAIATDAWQVAIVDYMVPGFPGSAALELLSREAPDLPVIVASGHAAEEVVAATIRLGAVDYLLKDDLARVAPAVEHALAEREMRLERRRALEALVASEVRFRTLFDRAPVALAEVDVTSCRAALERLSGRDGDLESYFDDHPEEIARVAALLRPVRVNDAAVRLFAAPDADSLLARFLDIWNAETTGRPAVVRFITHLVMLSPLTAYEVKASTASGREVIVLLNIDFIEPVEGNGSLHALIGMTDVTARQEADDALRERERMLSTLFANLPGNVYRCGYSPSYPVEFESDGMQELTGYPAGRAEDDGSANWVNILHPDDREAVWETLSAAVEAGEPYTLTYRIVTADGVEKWVWERGRGVRGPDGGAEAIEGFIADITEQRLAERELQLTRDRLEALIEATDAVIYMDSPTDPSVTQFVAGNLRSMLGYATTDWLADPDTFRRLVHPDDLPRVEHASGEVLATGTATAEYRLLDAGEDYRWIHDEMRLMYGEDGAPEAIAGQLWDITARKQAEEDAVAAERLTALRNRVASAFLTESDEDVFGTVLGIIQDELRSPIGIFGYLDDDGVFVAPSVVGDPWPRDPSGNGPPRLPRERWSGTAWGKALDGGATVWDETPVETPSGHGSIRRAIACPVVLGGTVIGLFAVANRPEPYTEDDRDRIENVAAFVAPILIEWLQRSRFEAALYEHQEQLTLRNRLAAVFLINPGDEIYAEVLGVVLEALESSDGAFYHLEDRELVVAARIQQGGVCRMPDAHRRFPLQRGSLATTAVDEQRSVVENRSISVPAAHVGIARALATPIIHGEDPIGVFMVANKDADYTDADVLLLEDLAGWVAPVLDARLRRQRAEASERQARERTDIALAGAELGMYHSRFDTDETDADEAYFRLLGYRPGELDLRPDSWTDLVHPDDLEHIRSDWAAVERGERDTYELDCRLRHKDGSWRWFLDRGRVMERDAGGAVVRISGTHLDITARREAEQAVVKSAERLRQTVHGTVAAMGSVVERRDPYTAGHERHVAELAGLIGRELGLSPADMETLELAAQVHDIGKIGVPAEILARPGRLGAAEMDLIRLHPQIGHDILASIMFEGPVALAVLQHHERLDGSGYPQGLTADEILPAARILAVADVVEAMASHRPYRPALGMESALEEIRDGAGRLYDADVVAACETIISRGDFTLD